MLCRGSKLGDPPQGAPASNKGVFVFLEESQSDSTTGFLRHLLEFLGVKRKPQEIHDVLGESEERGLIDEYEGDMIEGIVDLKQTMAREIMIPRTDVVFLPATATKDVILSTLIDSGHSRIPVYRENVDHIIGILNAKDLLPCWLKGEEELNVENMLREPFFVPETKPIKDLLDALRARESHIAIIVDEYGGTSGIVTIEDIIEEIIGEIRDEHDVEEELFVEQEDGSLFVSARANLADFEERLGVALPRGGYDTLGGFIIHLLGKVPDVGEEVVYDGLAMKILRGDKKRITRVLVSRIATESESESSSPIEPNP